MKITNIEEMAQNVGKKVYLQMKWDKKPILGTIRKNLFYDCDGDLMGFEGDYAVRYEEPDRDGSTWCSIDDVDFENGIIVLLETVE